MNTVYLEYVRIYGICRVPQAWHLGAGFYMLNPQREEQNTVFYFIVRLLYEYSLP